MPYSPKRPCSQPGCPNLITGKDSYCPNHAIDHRAEHDRSRGSSAQRGYGHRWRKESAAHLAENPLCFYCKHPDILNPGKHIKPRPTAANQVDHFIPCKPDDPMFWDRSNWRSSCHSCHSRKTVVIDNAFGNRKMGENVDGNREPALLPAWA